MQSSDFWGNVVQSAGDWGSVNPLLWPAGAAAGAGNYFRDSIMIGSIDPAAAGAIARINDPTFLKDQPYDVGQGDAMARPIETAPSVVSSVKDWIAGGAAAVTDAAKSATSSFGSSALPAWMTSITGSLVGGTNAPAPSSSSSLPLWIKTAIVLSLIVGTAVLVKKEL